MMLWLRPKAADEIIFGNVNRPLCFIQVPSKRLEKDTGTQVNNITFIVIADKVFGIPVYAIGQTINTHDSNMDSESNQKSSQKRLKMCGALKVSFGLTSAIA